MSKKSIDELVKGMDPSKEIKLYDNFDMYNAVYVSAGDHAEGVNFDPQANDSQDGAEDKKFQAAATKIKKMMGDRPAVIAKADATHYGMINGNFYWYNTQRMKANAGTWMEKTSNGTWGRPVQTDHSMASDKTLGRVLSATPIFYTVPGKDAFTPDGHIELIYYISDKEGIDKIVDGRFRTLSVSSSASPSSVKCSICGRSVNDWDCTHYRGKSYKAEDGAISHYASATGNAHPCNKDEQVAFWMWDNQKYSEVSYVGKPADGEAQHTDLVYVNIDGKDASDSIVNDKANFQRQVSIMVGSFDNQRVTGIKDQEDNLVGNEVLFSSGRHRNIIRRERRSIWRTKTL